MTIIKPHTTTAPIVPAGCICERFHKTELKKIYYKIRFGKKPYGRLESAREEFLSTETGNASPAVMADCQMKSCIL